MRCGIYKNLKSKYVGYWIDRPRLKIAYDFAALEVALPIIKRKYINRPASRKDRPRRKGY